MDRFSGAFIIACFVAFYAYLLAAAFRQKRTVERLRYPWRLPLLILFLIIAVVISHAAGGFAGSFFGHRPAWREALADAVVFCGLAIALWARIVLAGNWSSRTVFKEGHELIQRGPYRFVRHPMYSGMLLMLAGVVIWSANVGIAVIFAVCVVGVLLRAQQEEALLSRHFPTAYRDYRRHTKRLIPFVF